MAYLICSGIKPIENRTWKTNFRGRVLIHAGAKPDNIKLEIEGQATAKEIEMFAALNFVEENNLFGCILGSVEIVGCVQNHPSIWTEKTKYECRKCLVDKYDWQTCQECKMENKQIYNWVLANPILFDKPIENVKGKLSFWEYNDYKLTK